MPELHPPETVANYGVELLEICDWAESRLAKLRIARGEHEILSSASEVGKSFQFL